MRECMESGKPLISILLAVYEPQLDWLQQQLESLEKQSYPNLKLYIRDDSSTAVSFEEIRCCVESCIKSFPYEINRNQENLGSNKTFELLTQEAEGEYFAYCDQDDVWQPEKLAVQEKALRENDAQLVCSDMFVIDGTGKRTAKSLKEVRRHHKPKSGENLAPLFLLTNFVSGCTMLVRSETAKASVPFCPHMVHDHYIALRAAMRGKILYLSEPLISYRIHGGNQTGLMAGVRDRESYIRVRIDNVVLRLEWLRDHLPEINEGLLKEIDTRLRWMQARQRNIRDGKDRRIIWKYRHFGEQAITVFELAAPYLPNGLFQLAIDLAKHNYI